MTGSNRAKRESPVDLACKLHDTRYNTADLTKDPLKKAQIILAADRELLARVSELHKLSQSGRLDLNAGEILFANNMQIAFNAKLIADGRQVATLNVERAIGPLAMNALRFAAGPASILVLGMPTLPLYGNAAPKPAHPAKPKVVRFDKEAAWMATMSAPHPIFGY